MLQKWERSVPGCENVLKIANYFDVSVDYLLGNTDNPLSHKNPSVMISSTYHQIGSAITDMEKAEQKMKALLSTCQLQADLPDGASSKNKSNE